MAIQSHIHWDPIIVHSGCCILSCIQEHRALHFISGNGVISNCTQCPVWLLLNKFGINPHLLNPRMTTLIHILIDMIPKHKSQVITIWLVNCKLLCYTTTSQVTTQLHTYTIPRMNVVNSCCYHTHNRLFSISHTMQSLLLRLLVILIMIWNNHNRTENSTVLVSLLASDKNLTICDWSSYALWKWNIVTTRDCFRLISHSVFIFFMCLLSLSSCASIMNSRIRFNGLLSNMELPSVNWVGKI